MPFAAVGHVVAGSADTNNVTTGTLDTTGATLLVLVLSNYNAVATTISDSKGNTWTALTGFNQASNAHCRIYWSVPTSVGSGHTFTASSTAGYPSISVSAFSGPVRTSPADQQNGAGGASALSVGSVTPTEDNELLVTGVCCWTSGGGVGPSSVDAGFTFSVSILMDAVPNHYGGGSAYKIQTTAAAVNPAWTTTASVNAAVIATFRVARGSGMLLCF